MSLSRHRIAALITVLAACCSIPAVAQQKDVGDQWEITTEMSMQGMTMPGMTQKVCSPRNADPIPAGNDKDKCETYDIKHAGSTVSWKMRCTNPPSTGTGEMTYKGRDAYAGKMTMTTEGQTMQMKLAGRKLGECDAGEMKRQMAAAEQQVADAKRQSEEARAKQCAEGLKEMRPQVFTSTSAFKCSDQQKKEFCGKLQTTAGFAAVAGRPSAPGYSELADAGKVCAVDVEAQRMRMCKTAEAQEQVDFLADACIGYGQPAFGTKIAARECAGRGYTSPVAQKYSRFCTAYGRRNAMQADAEDGAPQPTAAKPATEKPAPAKSATDEAVSKGKELLKGLFR